MSSVVPPGGGGGTIRGVLQVGGFRTYRDLNRMSAEDHRNTLITELVGRTNQHVSHYQSLDNDRLAGAGAVLVFVRQARIRDDVTIKRMSDENLRNTLITELYAQTLISAPELHAMSNLNLVIEGLRRHVIRPWPGVVLPEPVSFVRGVLQLGGFRTYRDLNRMSAEDHRNTLITELVGRTNQHVSHYQSLDNDRLAGAGAVLVFVRQAKIRDDVAIKRMSDDDLRNTLITEISAHQVGAGHGAPPFQAMSNLELVARALSLTARAGL